MRQIGPQEGFAPAHSYSTRKSGYSQNSTGYSQKRSPRLSQFTRVFSLLCALACALALAGRVPARAEMPTGQPVDGIRCDQAEGVTFHIHQHLALLDRGKAVGVPSDVGRPLTANCLYWLHTHSSDGLIHVESPTIRTFTLGQFFDVWGQPLSATRAASLRAPAGSHLRFY